jgi:hypothetical protein
MSEGKTDKDFDTLMELLKGSPAGLAAIGGIMVSHAELDIISKDPRLSGDPLTALKALFEFHKLEVFCDDRLSMHSGDAEILECYTMHLTADDIKPEQ